MWFCLDLRAPTPSAAAELVYPNYDDLVYKIKQNRLNLEAYVKRNLEKKKKYVELLKAQKIEKKPFDLINKYKLQIDFALNKIQDKCRYKLEKNKNLYQNLNVKLDALSPLKTLSRGYSVVENVDGNVIKKASDLKRGESINVRFTDGKISATVN